MIREAIDKLQEIIAAKSPEPIAANREWFETSAQFVPASANYRELKPDPDPQPTPLRVSSLTAIVNYLEDNRDGFDLESISVHVESPWQVSVVDCLREDAKRDCLMIAKPLLSDFGDGLFGHTRSQEQMIIALQKHFRPSDELSQVLKLVGNLTAEAVKSGSDDGVSQEVAVRSGRVLKGIEGWKNPAMLVPRRSFAEVALEPVPFIVRFNGGSADTVPTITLHESDGGQWQLDAMEKIAAFLLAKRKDNAAWGIIA